MYSRIDVSHIVRSHFKTLRKFKGKEGDHIYWKDLFTFFIVPLTITLCCFYFKISIKPIYGDLIAAFALFGGFLFNLVAIIYSKLDRIKEEAISGSNLLKSKFVKEIHVNISYCIVLTIVIITLLITYKLEFPYSYIIELFKGCLEYLTIFLLSHFFITLLMIVNRMYILMNKEAS